MNYTSFSFVLFFLVVFLVYVVISPRIRWIWLLLASYFFFAGLGLPYLLFVLAAVSFISYWCGILIQRSTCDREKKRWFWAGVVTVLSQLVWLKYLPFIAENMNNLFNGLSIPLLVPVPNHLLSIGVSYFVFQGISYLIDIYLELLEPERHFGRFALAMSFFPKLLQGPIERGSNLLPQLNSLQRPTRDNFYAGAHLFLWGVFKKVVIADRLATFVDPVYGNVHLYSGLPLIIATYLYAFQIFFDFSGYTDMALGLARFFNIRLTQNFNSPYLADSIPDFWRRWHISFSSWILDYIFKPLQFSFRGWPTWGTPFALMITFLVSGFWHGASWCFIAWGGIHGVFLSLSTLTRKLRKKFFKSLGIDKNKNLYYFQLLVTFNSVCFAWIFFRSKSVDDALYVVVNAVKGIPDSINSLSAWSGVFMQGSFVATLLLMVFSVVSGMLDRRDKFNTAKDEKLTWLIKIPALGRGVVYGVFFYLIAFYGADTQSFIYLQF